VTFDASVKNTTSPVWTNDFTTLTNSNFSFSLIGLSLLPILTEKLVPPQQKTYKFLFCIKWWDEIKDNIHSDGFVSIRLNVGSAIILLESIKLYLGRCHPHLVLGGKNPYSFTDR
jgi:hypothetical protein